MFLSASSFFWSIAGKLLFPLHGDDGFSLSVIEGGTGAFDADAVDFAEGLWYGVFNLHVVAHHTSHAQRGEGEFAFGALVGTEESVDSGKSIDFLFAVEFDVRSFFAWCCADTQCWKDHPIALYGGIVDGFTAGGATGNEQWYCNEGD